LNDGATLELEDMFCYLDDMLTGWWWWCICRGQSM